MSAVFFYTWILNNSHSPASELSREHHQGRAQRNRPSCGFMIAPHDWPWLPGDANAWTLGTTQPPLLLLTQRNTGPFLFSQPFHNIPKNTTTGCSGFSFLWGAAVGHGGQPSLWAMWGKLASKVERNLRKTQHLLHIAWKTESHYVILTVWFPSCSFVCLKASVWVTQFSGSNSSTGQFLCYLPSSHSAAE